MPALLVPASADTTRLSNSLVKLLKSELSVSEAAIGVVLAFQDPMIQECPLMHQETDFCKCLG